MELKEFFEEYPAVAVACSGGVDSAFLLYQAKRYCEAVRAYFVQSEFQPQFEREDAEKLCEQFGVPLTVVDVVALSDERIRSNPADRCYYCKKKIFEAIRQSAQTDGFSILLEGTNASDEISDRPGVRALLEYGVRSPLRECNYNKERRPRRRESLSMTNPPTPASPPGFLPAGRLPGSCSPGWSRRRISCFRMALRIFGSASITGRQGSR